MTQPVNRIKLAEESPKTQKARKKLQKQLEAVDKMITPQALERKAIEIHRWIARHASHRIVLRSKAISLFDENRNAASLSQKVAEIVEQIRANSTQKNESGEFWNSKVQVVHQKAP